MNNFTVHQWVALFSQIGLTDENMQTWHQLFEKQYPDAHQSFLEWLGLEDDKIAAMRKKYSI